MRANIIFLIGLVTISSVVSLHSLNEAMLNDPELKIQVEQVRNTNMGSLILDLAELHTQTHGRFAVLFDAIGDLKSYLGVKLSQENRQFAEITAQWQLDVARITKQRNAAKLQYETDNSNLQSKLYPRRKVLQGVVASLKEQLQKLNKNKADLEAARLVEIKLYKAAEADYEEGIASIKKALPLLRTLRNDASFLEVNQEQFSATYNDMRDKLGRLQYGLLYTNFVQTLEHLLAGKNFTNQAQLNKVIRLLENLLSRLQRGLINLNNEEALNLKRYNTTHAALVAAIKSTAVSLATNELDLAKTNQTIKSTEQSRDRNVALYKSKVQELAEVNTAYKNRTNIHNQFLHQVGVEQTYIVNALAILGKAGITRNS